MSSTRKAKGKSVAVGGCNVSTLVKIIFAFCLLPFAFTLTGCRQDMHDQPKYEPLEPSETYRDGRSSRPLVEGTVPRGFLREDALLYTGRESAGQGAEQNTPAIQYNILRQDVSVAPAAQSQQAQTGEGFSNSFPFPVDAAVLDRGEERYNIYCSVCHDRLGGGLGMVVRRGLRQPPSFHIDRLRQAPAGYFFDVITNGFGAMPDYAASITPRDRWAIVAYIRALQLSHQGTLADVPAEERNKLNNAAQGQSGGRQQ
jgi:mono/diheme cytochrome c family protein